MENVCFYSPTGNYLLNHTEEVWITEVMETVGYFLKKMMLGIKQCLNGTELYFSNKATQSSKENISDIQTNLLIGMNIYGI